MKKYLGASIDAYVAIIVPFAIFFPLLFGIDMLRTGVDAARIILLTGCVLCTLIWGVYLKRMHIQLYSWGQFSDKGVQVKPLFAKQYFIEYAKCFGCGIGYYTHGFLNPQAGIRYYYIFLAYDKFDEQYRTRINLWRPTKTQIKVKYSKELYNFLIVVLPKTQAKALEQDYKKYKIKGQGDGLREP